MFVLIFRFWLFRLLSVGFALLLPVFGWVLGSPVAAFKVSYVLFYSCLMVSLLSLCRCYCFPFTVAVVEVL